MRTIMLLVTTAAMITGCKSQQEQSGSRNLPSMAFAPSAPLETQNIVPEMPPAQRAPAETKPLQISVPQLAYAYRLGFRLPGEKIAAAQEAHRATCEQMGPTRCQLLALDYSSADDVKGTATLKLRVASAEARRFDQLSTRQVAAAGGRAIERSVTAEDVSKNIVDAQARIGQRELLVSRLTEVLRTRRGTVTELVEAERSVAQAQEELDQAKGWLTELRGRVAMSTFDIRYSTVVPQASPESTQHSLGDAVAGSAATFLILLKLLATLLIYLIPWAIVATPIALLIHRATQRRVRAAERPDAERATPDEA